jgi:hypothetical protein
MPRNFLLSGTSVVFVRGIVLRDGPGRVSNHTQHLMGKKIVLGLRILTKYFFESGIAICIRQSAKISAVLQYAAKIFR